MVETELIGRERLLKRVRGAAPAVLSIVAPAGFGKTVFLRQLYGASFPSRLCNCAGIRDDVDLAGRLLPLLRDVLEDGSRSAADRLALAEETFAASTQPVAIFDAAEAIARNSSAMQFFARVLARRPAGMQIVVASREPFPVRFTRFVPPHQLLTLLAGDVAFDRDEIVLAFGEGNQDASMVDCIHAFTNGWPIAVLLLKRIACEGRLRDVLERVERRAFEELHDYIGDEILAGFDDRTLRSLFACAVVPDATAADVADAYDDGLSEAELDDLVRLSPFLSRDGSIYRVQPLIAAVLAEHQRARRRALVAGLAACRGDEGDFERQAHLLNAIGDQRDAAAALARCDGISKAVPSLRYRGILATFDRATIFRYPRLWATSAMARIYASALKPLCDESELLRRILDSQASADERITVCFLRALLLTSTGRAAEARAEMELSLAQLQLDQSMRAYSEIVLGIVRARCGDVERAGLSLEHALAASDASDVVAAIAYTCLAVDVARPRGDAIEEQLLTIAAQRAESTKFPNVIALVTAHRLVRAWFDADEAAVSEHARHLHALETEGVAGFRYLAACAANRESEPAAEDAPEFVVFGHLIALQRAHDETRRVALGRAAVALAETLDLPYLRTIAAVAMTSSDDAFFDRYAREASRAAARVTSAPLQHAVRAIAAGTSDAGMLAGFVARVRNPQPQTSPLEIGMWTGRVNVDGKPVALGGRELELLIAIAFHRDGIARGRLAAQLWPDLEEAAARNALSVCLHRLRARLGRDDAIERDDDVYRVHRYAAVTTWRLDRIAPLLRAKTPIRESERTTLERLWEELCEPHGLALASWEWFAPAFRRLQEASIDVAHRLGRDALDRGKALAALWYAQSALTRDECDETACEIALRAQLALGDRPAAMRTLRRYRDVLKSELSAEPSRSLVELLHA